MTEESEPKNDHKKKKRTMRSFEAEPDVEEMLNDAEKLGAVQKKLINKALRKYFPAALKAEVKRMREQLDEIERRNTGAGNN